MNGRKYLGGFIGSKEGKHGYASDMIDKWYEQVKILSSIARSEQAAYTGFISGFKHRVTYFLRTIPELRSHIIKLDEAVSHLFIPAITYGHECSEDERNLALSIKLGGLSILKFDL